MNRRGLGALIGAAVVVMAAALYLAGRRAGVPATTGAAVLPVLAAHLNEVSAVAIRKGGREPAVILKKTGTAWSVTERAGYPADVAKLRKLLISLRDARIVEEKTADPARYASIGVGDPAEPGAIGAEITLTVPEGSPALIIGKPVGSGNFVRRAGEKQSYSAEPSISVETEPRFWLEPRLFDAPVTTVQSLEVKLAAGPSYALHRLTPADAGFELRGVPAGRQALDAKALAPSPSAFANLTIEDVAPAADLDFSQASQAALGLANGDTLTIIGTIRGEHHWIKVSSSKDAALAKLADGRAFDIASYRYEAIFRPLDQLLVPLPSAPPKSAAGNKAGASRRPPPGAP